MITEILEKYKAVPDYWYPDVKEKSVYKSPDFEKYCNECKGIEIKLMEKWKKYIPEGWYGFNLGSPFPPIWYNIIDEFLTYLEDLLYRNMINQFEIHQIKVKFGALRFYISFNCENKELREFIYLQIDKIQSYLTDTKLIF